MVPARRLPLLTPAEAFGPDIERFRDSRQALAAWWDKQTQVWSLRVVLRNQGGRVLACQLGFIDRHLQNDFLGVVPARWLKPRAVAATLAITDAMNAESEKTFRCWQRGGLLSRSPGFAADDRFHVECDGWYAYRRDDGTITLSAHGDGDSVHLDLAAGKPIVYHGQSGYAQRDASTDSSSGGASFYCSYPRLKATGRMLLDSKLELVEGLAWLDHEKLTTSARFRPAPRDFSEVIRHSRHERITLQLNEDRELMLFSPDGEAFTGSFIDAQGTPRHLIASDVRIENFEFFTSARTGARYPVKRKIVVDALGLELELRPALSDQEADTARINLASQWNGLVNASGTLRSAPLSGTGFMELHGYDSRSRARLFEFLTRS